MSDFWIFFKVGLHHILDINGYDHILFLIVLSVPYIFKDWKRLLLLVTFFTIGHTISLLLSVLNVITVKTSLIEFFIPITILITALYNIFTSGKSVKKDSVTFILIITLLFGIIHGLAFSNYFKALLPGKPSDKLIPLFEFATGIEVAQLAIVTTVLILSFIVQTLFKFSKRDFILTMSAFVIGVVVPMIINNDIWHK